MQNLTVSDSRDVSDIISDNVLDMIEHNDFFRYTAGRWVFNESRQLAERSVRFDMNELARVTATCFGTGSCLNIEKLPEGNFNKTFLMTLDSGLQVVAKVPNPNAGRPHSTTASEVATMDYVRWALVVSQWVGRSDSSFRRVIHWGCPSRRFTHGVQDRGPIVSAQNTSSWTGSRVSSSADAGRR